MLKGLCGHEPIHSAAWGQEESALEDKAGQKFFSQEGVFVTNQLEVQRGKGHQNLSPAEEGNINKKKKEGN